MLRAATGVLQSMRMGERSTELRTWLAKVLAAAPFEIEPASVDASFRRYFRVTTQDHSLIVMDAPPDKEDSGPFMDVARRLSAAGLNVPQVVDADPDRGFLLLTDLGNNLYLQALAGDRQTRSLYQDAMRALVLMQSDVEANGLPAYDRELLMTEMGLFRDWLLGRHLGLSWHSEALQATFDFLAEAALCQPTVFVHRDYHSRNLMVCAGNNPGILDFQDAVCGPVSYDLVSLLKDCYVKWPAATVDEHVQYYLAAAAAAGIDTGKGDEDFLRYFDLMGVQRHLKASGIFARLCHRDGKQGYLADVPRTLSYITDCAGAFPELRYLDGLIREDALPALAATAAP